MQVAGRAAGHGFAMQHGNAQCPRPLGRKGGLGGIIWRNMKLTRIFAIGELACQDCVVVADPGQLHGATNRLKEDNVNLIHLRNDQLSLQASGQH